MGSRANRSAARRSFVAAAIAALLASSTIAGADFSRGDVDGSGSLTVTDPVRILLHLFSGIAGGIVCDDAADADDSGAIEITDAVFVLRGLFCGEALPPAPFPDCGADPTEDALGCDAFAGCRGIVQFYDFRVAADAVFFALDRSPSVGGGAALHEAKEEAARAIDGLAEDGQFGIVFFDANLMRYPLDSMPATATDEGKAAARDYLESVPNGSGTCVQAGLLAALEMAEKAARPRKILFYWGDGGGTCQGQDEATYLEQTIEAVTARNEGAVRIFAVGYWVTEDDVRWSFLHRLAELNGGELLAVPPP